MAQRKKSSGLDYIGRTARTVINHLADAFNGKLIREDPLIKGMNEKLFGPRKSGGGRSGVRTRESMEQQKVKDFIGPPKSISRRVRNTDFIGSAKTAKKGGR